MNTPDGWRIGENKVMNEEKERQKEMREDLEGEGIGNAGRGAWSTKVVPIL